jgi:hypothetical protein
LIFLDPAGFSLFYFSCVLVACKKVTFVVFFSCTKPLASL